MSQTFDMPDLGEGIAEAEVIRWCVAAGEAIGEDEMLLEVQTDKAIMEIPSPVSGTVVELLVPVGQVVPVGTPLVVLETVEQEDAPDPPAVMNGHAAAATVTAAAAQGVRATPLVRRLAAEAGLDLASVAGSGPRGAVTAADVTAAIATGAGPEAAVGVPLRGIRRMTAERLARAHREIPAVTIVEECDFSRVKRLQLSHLPYVVLSTVAALRRFPEFNATLKGDQLVMERRYDIGIAMQTEDGLLVPVLRGADELDLDGMAREIRRIGHAAAARELGAGDLRGSTFTISAAGRRGGMFATPIINAPEVAILGVHRVGKRPVVRGDRVTVARTGFLSFTFDHRVADGLRAGGFLQAVIRGIERPDGLTRHARDGRATT